MKELSLDPRSKLFVGIVAAIILMILHHWLPLMIAGITLVTTVLLLHLGRLWLTLLKGLGFATGSFFVIAWLAFDLPTGITAALRLLALGTVFFLFFQTTSPEVLSNALMKMGIPYSFAFMLSASMQFVHVLTRRAANIRDAQRARGILLEGGFGTIRHLPALAGPLLIQAFKFADELAEAMEARGFGAPGRRFRHESKLKLLDGLVILLSLIALVTVYWVK